MLWLLKFPCYLYLVCIVWLDVCDQVFECVGNLFLLGALITSHRHLPRCLVLDLQWISLLKVLLRTEANFKDLVLSEWYHTSVASSTVFRRVMIKSELSLLIANYIKIKRVESAQSHIAITVEENWTLEEWESIEDTGRGIRKLEREIERRIDKDNTLESKTTWDYHLFLQPSKRLKNHLSCKGGFLE